MKNSKIASQTSLIPRSWRLPSPPSLITSNTQYLRKSSLSQVCWENITFPMPFSEVHMLIQAPTPMLRRGRYPGSYKPQGSHRHLNKPSWTPGFHGGREIGKQIGTKIQPMFFCPDMECILLRAPFRILLTRSCPPAQGQFCLKRVLPLILHKGCK